MSEEVTGVTLQVTEKAVSTGLNASAKVYQVQDMIHRRQ